MKKLVKSLFYYLISAVGISLTIKASIGVSSFNSLNVTLANLSHIHIGTITTFMNLSFLLASLCLDKDKKWSKYLLMLVATLSFGEAINVVYYYVFSSLHVSAYFFNVIMFVLGVCISGFGTGQVVRLNILTFPIESFCQLMAKRTNFTFSTYRYGVDLVCVLLSLLISLSFSLPIVVREGTIMSLFLLSSVINWSKNLNLFP